jgi:hypothetical protein
METLTLADLKKQTAARLAGQPVDVRDRDPYLKGRVGQAHNHNGRAVVDVSPSLDDSTWLHVFLHECGHIKHDFENIPPTGKAALPPGSVNPTPLDVLQRQYHPRILAEESRAEKAALEWGEYAEKNYKRYGRADYPVLWRKLLALRDYTEPVEVKSRVKPKPNPWANYP